MSNAQPFARVWMPLGEENQPQIPVDSETLTVNNWSDAMNLLFPWVTHLIRTSEPEEAEELVVQLRQAGMCSPELDGKKLAQADFGQIDILLTADDNFREHLAMTMNLGEVEFPSQTEENKELLESLTGMGLSDWMEWVNLPYPESW